MSQHNAVPTTGSRIASVTQWTGATLAAILIFALGCIGGYQSKDSFGQVPFYLIYGGNMDPGDGDGGGLARDQMVAGGWTTYENSYQIQWKADIGQGTEAQLGEALTNGNNAFRRFCRNGCVVAGFSLGTVPALALASDVGLSPQNNYLFGAPQPSTGIWHEPYADNFLVEPLLDAFGDFDTNQFVPAGTQVFFDSRDPYANTAPQCGGPGLFTLTLDGHYIVSRAAAESSHVWVGSDGAIMHEVGYHPSGYPRSGSDPSRLWDLCPPGS